MVGISQQESGLDPAAVHRNPNGTIDVGLAQVNSANFGWLGLTMQTAMDPCRNLAAGARVLLAKYNGNPPATIKLIASIDPGGSPALIQAMVLFQTVAMLTALAAYSVSLWTPSFLMKIHPQV